MLLVLPTTPEARRGLLVTLSEHAATGGVVAAALTEPLGHVRDRGVVELSVTTHPFLVIPSPTLTLEVQIVGIGRRLGERDSAWCPVLCRGVLLPSALRELIS